MSPAKNSPVVNTRFDRPSDSIATKNTEHAPWHDDDGHQNTDKSQHRRYHGLFEDLMN